PGDYILRVDQGNFTGGGALANLRASGLGSPDPDNNVDNDDNGQALAGQGHVTFAITLSYNNEPTAGPGNDTNNTLDIGVLSSAPVAVDDTASVAEYATVTGNDTTIGGPGDDYHFVDDAGDVVTDGIGQGTGDRVFASTSYTLTAGAEIEKFSTNDHAGTSPINLTGNELDNVIYGNAGDNGLNGVGGNDTLVGLGGIDTLDGGVGNDTLIGGDGADILLGGANDDQLYGQAGNDH